MVGQHKQSARPFDAKIYDCSDAKSVKVRLLWFLMSATIYAISSDRSSVCYHLHRRIYKL